MTKTESVDIVDAVRSIYPELDFLSLVVSFMADIEISEKVAEGLSRILANISEELQAAIREVPDDNP